MTVVVIIVILCLVIMCKLIVCLSDLSMMDCSGVIGMYTARVSALAKFLGHAHFLMTTPTFYGPRPLSMDHAHFLWTWGKPSPLLDDHAYFQFKTPMLINEGKKNC